MDDNVLNIDLDHLTVGEIEEIEELTGQPIEAIGDRDRPKGKLLRAIGFVARKRVEPSFTWEDAANLKVKLSEGEAPPTNAAG